MTAQRATMPAEIRAADAAWSDRTIMLATVAIWLALVLLMNPVAEFPVNDDWAYAYAAKSIAETGQFRLTGFSAPNLIAQAYWGALFCLPFGFSFTALHVSTAVLAMFGLLCAYQLMRECGAGTLIAATAALTLGCNPLYLQLSNSFMTDVPFTVLATLSFCLYVRGVNRDSPTNTVAAFAVAGIAIFVRQFGLFLPLAFGAALLVRRGIRPATITAALLPVLLFVGLHVAFQHWILTTGRAPRFAQALGALTHISFAERLPKLRFFGVAILPYFGLFILPFLTVALVSETGLARGRRIRVFWLPSLTVGAVLFLALIFLHDIVPAFGNVLRRYGVGPLTLRDTFLLGLNEPVFPGAALVWSVLTAAGCWASGALAVLLGRVTWTLLRHALRPGLIAHLWPIAMMLTFIGGYLAAIVAAALLDDVFDRYILALLMPFSVCLLLLLVPVSGRLRRHPMAFAPLVCCGLFAVGATHDYFAFNRARWSAIHDLLASGIPAGSIDGGFEYGGWYLFRIDYVQQPGRSYWWIEDERIMIALGPVPGFVTERTLDFVHYLWPSTTQVHVLHRQ